MHIVFDFCRAEYVLRQQGRAATGVGTELGLEGIGLAVTRRFVREGARVVAGSRTVSAELAELVDGGAVDPISVDLAEPDGPARLIAAAAD
jgi:NAD(P)-dependent dehydrogenase (short-subunit alcohol dehydrogenase family)